MTAASQEDLSAPPPSLPAMQWPHVLPHPWRRLRELAHVTLSWHDDGPMGLTTHSTATISIRRGLSWEERRCTVQHELVHVEHGPVPAGLAAKNEEFVRRETALRMIPDIRPVGDAIAWSLSPEEAAEELGVDLPVLRYRLKHMSPMEKSWLDARLEWDDAVPGGFC